MLIDAIAHARKLRAEIPHLIQPELSTYYLVCLLTELEKLQQEVTAAESRGREAGLREAADVARDYDSRPDMNRFAGAGGYISIAILSLLSPANKDTE